MYASYLMSRLTRQRSKYLSKKKPPASRCWEVFSFTGYAEAFQTQGGKLVLAKDWIEKWDGHLPTVQSGSGMIIDVRELLNVKADKAKE